MKSRRWGLKNVFLVTMAVLFTATSVVILNNNSAVAAGTDPCIKTTDNGNIRFYPNGCGNGTPLVLVPYDDNPSKFFVDGKHAYNDTTGEEVPGLVSYYYSSGAHTVNMIREDGTTETIAVRGEDVDGGKIFDKPTDVASSEDKPVGEMSKAECDASDSAVWSGDEESGECISSTKDSCDLGALGWIICPSTQLIESMVNGIMQVITNQMKFEALTGSSTRTGMQSGWAAIRDIANIAFAIVFLIVIYSTATSTGLNNYSIKKIIPRLVIAAILVNISFWICAAMVDLSNIAGSSAKAFIDNNMVAQVSSAVDPNVNPIVNSVGSFVGLIIGGTITLVGGMVVGVLFWTTAVVGLVVVLATLAFRTFALVALIVISPLAFVAYLLPNTEKWFKKWLNEFTRMLLAYPAIAFVWGLTSFMIAVLSQDAGASEEGGLSFIDAILVPLVALIPAFTILPILKSSGNIMGKLTNLAQQGVGKMGGNALNKWWGDKRQKDFIPGAIDYAKRRAGRGVGLAEAKKNEAADSVENARKALSKEQESYNSKLGSNPNDAGDLMRLREKQKRGKLSKDESTHMAALEEKRKNGILNNMDKDRLQAAKNNLADAQGEFKKTSNALDMRRKGVAYRISHSGDLTRATRAKREEERNRDAQHYVAGQLSSAKIGDSTYRKFTGAAGASADDAKAMAERAFMSAQQVGDKEFAEAKARSDAILGNAETDGHAIANGEISGVLKKYASGDKSGATAKVMVDGQEFTVDANDRAMRVTMAQHIAKYGSAAEVAQLVELANAESDNLVAKAITDAIAQSPKKPVGFGGKNVPDLAARAFDAVDPGADMAYRAATVGDLKVGEFINSGASELDFLVRAAQGARQAVNNNIGYMGGTTEDASKALANIQSTLATALNSTSGAQVVESEKKAQSVINLLVSTGMSQSDAESIVASKRSIR